MTRELRIRIRSPRPRCRDCDAYLQQSPGGLLRCPWSRAEAGDCGWPKGRETRDTGRPAIDYRHPTAAWR